MLQRSPLARPGSSAYERRAPQRGKYGRSLSWPVRQIVFDQVNGKPAVGYNGYGQSAHRHGHRRHWRAEWCVDDRNAAGSDDNTGTGIYSLLCGEQQDGSQVWAQSVWPYGNSFWPARLAMDGSWSSMHSCIVALSRRRRFRGTKVLYGVLRSTTEQVVDWAVRLEASLAEDGAPAGQYAGLAICPPINPGANQAIILQHFQAILEHTTSSIAVLPASPSYAVHDRSGNNRGKSPSIKG